MIKKIKITEAMIDKAIEETYGEAWGENNSEGGAGFNEKVGFAYGVEVAKRALRKKGFSLILPNDLKNGYEWAFKLLTGWGQEDDDTDNPIPEKT
jgi:hypothetical protein